MSLVGHYLLHFIALHGINLTTTVDLIAADDDFFDYFCRMFHSWASTKNHNIAYLL
jgi:hypothetical protein